MKKREPIIVRLFSEAMSEEERAFYGVPDQHSPWPAWPPLCVNCLKPAGDVVPAMAERKGDEVHLDVPVCADHRELKNRNFHWVTTTGLWISYLGITGFFVTLYFTVSISGRPRGMGNELFFLSLLSLVTAFFGFYLVRLFQSFSKEFREWLRVPALSVRIRRSSPYFRDLALRFGNEEAEKAFVTENKHLLVETLDAIAAKRKEEAQKAAAKGGESAEHLYELGLTLERLADFSAARDTYRRVIELKEDNADAWRHLGACWFALSHPHEAEGAFNTALKIQPNDADTLLLLSSLYEMTNRPFKAEARLKQAAKLYENDPDILFRLGDYLLRKNRVNEAREAFQISLAADPVFSRSLVGLGLAQAQLGDREGFIRTLMTLREIAPDLAHRLESTVNMSPLKFTGPEGGEQGAAPATSGEKQPEKADAQEPAAGSETKP